MKLSCFDVICAIGFAISPIAFASDDSNDACGAIICLAGEMTGNSGGSACSPYIKEYFSIIAKKNGNFNPARTAQKRMDWLNQCPMGNDDTGDKVNSRYGKRRGL